MPLWVQLIYAYLVGWSFAACAGSLIELRAGGPVGLRAPFVTHSNIPRSLAMMLAAGPYIMLTELRQAVTKARLPVLAAVTGLACVSMWALASGILLVELMALIRGRFS